jgi:CBS domain-containing protein
MTMLVRDVMTSPAITIDAGTRIRDAVALLDRKRITILPVVGPAGELVGVISEADLLTEAMTHEPGTPHRLEAAVADPARLVAEVMTRLVSSVPAYADLDEAVELMATTMIKSLPVVEHGYVVGMISRSDVIHLLANRDQRLRTEVVDLLNSECPDWLVEVADGVVTVTGPADQHERRLAAVLAGSITGVQAVKVR